MSEDHPNSKANLVDDPNKMQFHNKHDSVLAQLLVLHVQYYFVLEKPLVSLLMVTFVFYVGFVYCLLNLPSTETA